jgi:hypothetical protein
MVVYFLGRSPGRYKAGGRLFIVLFYPGMTARDTVAQIRIGKKERRSSTKTRA